MFKVSALALVVALCNAATGSRLLLQAGAPAQPPPPPVNGIPPTSGTGVVPPVPPANIPPSTGTGAPPAIPPQARPQQPAYNPMNNPYCNPMSGMYDAQDCYQTSFMYGQQPGFGGAPGQQTGFGGANMNNPYCNPASGMYDLQDCIQYGGMLNGGSQGGLNMNNPYCNPASGMYDLQDCIQYGGMFQQPRAPAGNPAAPGQGQRPGAANPINPMNPYCNPYSGNYDIQDCYRSTYGFYF